MHPEAPLPSFRRGARRLSMLQASPGTSPRATPAHRSGRMTHRRSRRPGPPDVRRCIWPNDDDCAGRGMLFVVSEMPTLEGRPGRSRGKRTIASVHERHPRASTLRLRPTVSSRVVGMPSTRSKATDSPPQRGASRTWPDTDARRRCPPAAGRLRIGRPSARRPGAAAAMPGDLVAPRGASRASSRRASSRLRLPMKHQGHTKSNQTSISRTRAGCDPPPDRRRSDAPTRLHQS